MSDSRSSGTVVAERNQQQSGTAGGSLSKFEPYVGRGTNSGALSLIFSVAMLAIFIHPLMKENKSGVAMHALMAAYWIVIGVVQCRAFGQGGQTAGEAAQAAMPPIGRLRGPHRHQGCHG